MKCLLEFEKEKEAVGVLIVSPTHVAYNPKGYGTNQALPVAQSLTDYNAPLELHDPIITALNNAIYAYDQHSRNTWTWFGFFKNTTDKNKEISKAITSLTFSSVVHIDILDAIKAIIVLKLNLETNFKPWFFFKYRYTYIDKNTRKINYRLKYNK